MSGMARGLLGALSGAMRGRREKEERERLQAERDAQLEQESLFNRLRLLQIPGVEMGEQPEPGTPLEQQPAGMPASMRAVQPARNTIEVGRLALDGEETPVHFDPSFSGTAMAERERTSAEDERLGRERANREAYDFLRGADADAYPSYVEGYDYTDEVGSFLDDQRSRENDRLRSGRAEELNENERAERRRIEQARTRAFNMFQTGGDLGTVMRQVNSDPNLGDLLSYDDFVAIQREARTVQRDNERFDPDAQAKAERRTGWESRIGKPATPFEQEIMAALAEGAEPDEIVADMQASGLPASRVSEAERYMSGRRR